jgi:hypothetical protein
MPWLEFSIGKIAGEGREGERDGERGARLGAPWGGAAMEELGACCSSVVSLWCVRKKLMGKKGKRRERKRKEKKNKVEIFLNLEILGEKNKR